MKRIAVFCASSIGFDNKYKEQAYLLGKTFAERNIELVYGGSNVGLMGEVANGVIENNGIAIGVLPHFLKAKEIAHTNLSELILVETMHERKAMMDQLADGVLALPGGFGTLEELFEALTWGQLGIHKKPVAMLNIDGFYDGLLSFIRSIVDKGFMKEVYLNSLLTGTEIPELLDLMANYNAPETGKWGIKAAR